jgi:hypothetical protein
MGSANTHLILRLFLRVQPLDELCRAHARVRAHGGAAVGRRRRHRHAQVGVQREQVGKAGAARRARSGGAAVRCGRFGGVPRVGRHWGGKIIMLI